MVLCLQVAYLLCSIMLVAVKSEPPSNQYGTPLAPPISSYGTPNYNVNGHNGDHHNDDHSEVGQHRMDIRSTDSKEMKNLRCSRSCRQNLYETFSMIIKI